MRLPYDFEYFSHFFKATSKTQRHDSITDKVKFYGLSIHPTVSLKYIQAFIRALNSPSCKCVFVICNKR